MDVLAFTNKYFCSFIIFMATKNNQEKRSLFVTVLAIVIGIIAAVVSFLMLPIADLAELAASLIGILITIGSVFTAIDGRSDSLNALIQSLYNWS